MSAQFLSVDVPDQITAAVFLEAPAQSIVLLQAYIESHESLGAVRTLNRTQNLLCILSTRDMLGSLLDFLFSVRDTCPWREARTVDKALLEFYRMVPSGNVDGQSD
ncbi:MAG: DUF4911 domain-containing protein [Bdellovibrionales bacterium]|nr:DUF4911 domain-containing protein [Bdellovibrionales bacterium]